jgi:hypothetical protein
MIAAPVQCDVDVIPKGSHYISVSTIKVRLRSLPHKRSPRPMGEVMESLQTCTFIPRQPSVQRLATHAPVPRHLGHHPTISNHCQDRLVSLLSHAHFPHARERDKSAEVGVTHQPKVCNPSAEGLLRPISRTCTHDGARAGNRTLNLGIKRLPTDRVRASQGVSVRLSRIRVMTQSSQRVSRCLTESPGEAVNEAVKRFMSPVCATAFP